MKALLKKLSAFSLGPLFAALVGFITVPVVTYIITPDEYARAGMFTLAQNTIALFLCLGLDQAFIREFHENKDTGKLLSNAMLLPTVFTVLLDALLLLFRHPISQWLFYSPDEMLAVFALAALFPAMLVERFALMKLRMEEKGLFYSLFTILLKFLTLVFTIVLLVGYQKSFRSVVYALSLAEIICGLILFFVLIAGTRLSFASLDRALMKKMLRFGLPLLPASALMWVLTSMDKAMLRIMSTNTELGLYTAAFKIVAILSIIQNCFTLFWTPLSYRWYETNADKRNFSVVMRLVAIGMTLLSIGLLLAKDLVALVLGSNFTAAIYIFPFLTLHPIMYTMSETTVMGISFKRKSGYNVIVTALSAAANITLNLLLIPIWGAKGAAFATGMSYMVFFWVRTLISRRIWWNFPIVQYVLYSVLILINCAMHTFITGWTPYLVSAVSLIIVLLVNIRKLTTDLEFLRHDIQE